MLFEHCVRWHKLLSHVSVRLLTIRLANKRARISAVIPKRAIKLNYMHGLNQRVRRYLRVTVFPN